MVGQDLSGLRVLDAFGGSGLLALEAYSRGADVVVVEKNRAAGRAIQANADDLDASIRVQLGDVLRLLPALGGFDGVLADPPYAMNPGPFLELAAPAVHDWLVLESDVRMDVPDAVDGLARARARRYGDTMLHLFRRPS